MRIGFKGLISSLLVLGLSRACGRLWLWRILWLECFKSLQDSGVETPTPDVILGGGSSGGAKVPHEWDWCPYTTGSRKTPRPLPPGEGAVRRRRLGTGTRPFAHV